MNKKISKKKKKRTDAQAFGAALKSLREKRKLRQEDLGYSQPYVAQLEGGHRMPSFKTINKLAVALRVKPTTLLDWEKHR